MKIYTHWQTGDGDVHTKHFFGRKSQEETEAKRAADDGKQVVARHSWDVEPKAEAVAEFCQSQLKIRDYKEDYTHA